MTNVINLDDHRALIPRTVEWWDEWFLGLAAYTSTASKDPSTQIGAVIARPNKTVVSIGYNGFPRGIEDTLERLKDRDAKYSLIVHGEINAILTAQSSVRGCVLYTYPLPPCDRCAVQIIQAGIQRVVSMRLSGDKQERWGDSVEKSMAYFREAGVSYIFY